MTKEQRKTKTERTKEGCAGGGGGEGGGMGGWAYGRGEFGFVPSKKGVRAELKTVFASRWRGFDCGAVASLLTSVCCSWFVVCCERGRRVLRGLREMRSSPCNIL